MMTGQVEVRVVRDYPSEPIIRLYRAGGWWCDHYDPAHVPRMVRGSYAVAVAVDSSTGETVGMGRAISDGASDAYLQDVIVVPAYRGQGIARGIVAALLDRCAADGILWVGVVAEPASIGFWERAGFSSIPGHVAMRLAGKD